MKSKSMVGIFLILFAAMGLMGGCATVKTWSSDPSAQTVRNNVFEASFEPLMKEGQKFYDRFLFRLKNKTDRPLIIDWQDSRYIQDGRENGRFVFTGVASENINTLPPDTVAPGAEFTKTIAPERLIGYERIKSGALQPGESGFSAGVIPAGEHGLLLIVKQDQKTISEKILLKITVKQT